MAAGQSTLEAQFAEMGIQANEWLLAGRYAEAEKQFRDLIQLLRRAKGPEHRQMLAVQNSRAQALSCLGRHVEAETIFREVLQVKQQSPDFGMEHECTLGSVSALGNCLLLQHRYKEAEPMLRKVYDLDVRLLGPGAPETLTIQSTLAKCLVQDSQCEEAEGLLHDALERFQALADNVALKATGIGSSMVELAKCKLKTGKLPEAESLLRAAVKYTRHHVGEENMLTIRCMEQHAVTLQALGKHAAAEVMYRLTVQGSRATFGWEHHYTLASTRNYAECLLEQRKTAPAETLLRDTLSHLQQALGTDHPTVLEWTRELAKCLQAQCLNSKRNEAKALLRRARELAGNKQG